MSVLLRMLIGTIFVRKVNLNDSFNVINFESPNLEIFDTKAAYPTIAL